MHFTQSQNLGYGISGLGLVAAITLGLSGSPSWLTSATLGISGGVFGSTSIAGCAISRREDELKARYIQIAEEAEVRHDRKRVELEAQLETAKNSYVEALQKAQQFKVECEELRRANGTLSVNLERLRAAHEATRQSLEQSEAAYAMLQEQYSEVEASSDRYWSANAELEQQITELKFQLNRSQSEIEKDIKLATIERMEGAVQEAVVKAVEAKMRELDEAHSDIQKLLTRLEESNGILQDTRENALPAIRSTFDATVNARDLQLMKLSGENNELNERIKALLQPRRFSGETSIDRAGNRIIEHFYAHGIVLDALEAVSVPQGFRLRYKCDRNASQTKLTQEEFAKVRAERGMQGLSHSELQFDYDPRNLILSVLLDTVGFPFVSTSSTTAATPTAAKPITVAQAVEAVTEKQLSAEDAFRALGCFPTSEFENVIRDKFVPRVRVVAGSTGGKSPLMELIAVALAKQNQAELWLLNPLPGSEKDWFSVPGLIQGTEPIQQQIGWMDKAYKELMSRRKDLSQNYKFLIVMADEVNDLARHYSDLGRVLKSFYQVSDHAQMGIVTAAQGANVSGVSGAAKKDNSEKLMEEDFQNSAQVFTSQAASTWIKKHRKDLEPTLKQLQKLCDELNRAEGLSARPKSGTKIVDRTAYRVALAVSPASDEPFFFQIPPYSFYAGKLDGISFPSGAVITARHDRQVALGLVADAAKCPECGSTHTQINKNLKAAIKRVCKDCGCYYNVPKTAG
ncbi:hypothetical protein IFO70_36190 [Phormidium tenue FACHB-886]|nr:hypothetical protein [Phormidium tenue FACHB-886]